MQRVLLVGDAGRPTGFERVVRAIGNALHETGRYEVIVRGVGLTEESVSKVPPYPYPVKPTVGKGGDVLGVKNVPTWLEEDKPDLIVLVQDIWNQLNYLAHLPSGIPKLGYFPIDTPNLKWSFAIAAAALDDAVPYTTFGAQETAAGVRDALDIINARKELYGLPDDAKVARIEFPRDGNYLTMRMDRLAELQNVENYKPIQHGSEPHIFYPMDKKEARKALFGDALPADAFVVMSVNTNQFRKRQDLTIRAFAKVAREVPNAFLVLHATGNDQGGWDLAQLARLYGVEDRVICTHWMMPELSEETLRTLYNTADVHINNGGGEGWGLTTHESALCGVAQVVPDWSATKELWSGDAVMLPVRDYRFETRFMNTAHAVISADDIAHRLIYLANNPEARQGCADACRNRALQFPTWEQVGKEFVKRVDALAEKNQNLTPMTLAEAIAARKGDVKSALWQIL